MSPKLTDTINYLLFLNSQSERKDLTNKKLQKLLYYSQAWSLVVQNKQLFNEDFQAWVHGPAIPVVYKKFKNFGSSPIDANSIINKFESLTENDKHIIEEIWRVYGKYDAQYLEILTHNETPWLETRNGQQPYEASTNIIGKAVMKNYYAQKK